MLILSNPAVQDYRPDEHATADPDHGEQSPSGPFTGSEQREAELTRNLTYGEEPVTFEHPRDFRREWWHENPSGRWIVVPGNDLTGRRLISRNVYIVRPPFNDARHPLTSGLVAFRSGWLCLVVVVTVRIGLVFGLRRDH
jgi:hypothetical protein